MFDQVKNFADLLDRKACGRLVHDHHTSLKRYCSRNFDGLLLAARHPLYIGAYRADIDAQAIEKAPGIDLHPPLIEPAKKTAWERAGYLSAEEHVGNHIEVRSKSEILINHLDTKRAGIQRRPDCLRKVFLRCRDGERPSAFSSGSTFPQHCHRPGRAPHSA